MFNLEAKIENVHRKTVSSVAISPSGSHFITGALDGELKMWDFAGMTKRKRYFRKISPEEGIAINSIQWNTPGNAFLVCPASSSAKIYDGEGNELAQTPKGDMYLKDLNHTAGHIGHINGGAWDKADRNQFMTWANDGSIRLWDVNDMKKNKTVLKLKNRQNVKYYCTAACLAGERFIIGASTEGVIYLWDYKRPLRPKTIKTAHETGQDICSLLPDSEHFFSRSVDGVIKKWDFRQLNTFETVLENESAYMKLRFSADKKNVLAIRNQNGGSELVFLNKGDLTESRTFPIGDVDAVCFDWNTNINQVAFGTVKRSVLFFGAEGHSQKGAKLCANAAEYELSDEDFSAMIDSSLLKEFRKVSRPVAGGKKVSMPEMSKTETNRVVKKNTFASGVFKKMKKNNTLRDQNPRESILRFSKKAKDNPLFIRESGK